MRVPPQIVAGLLLVALPLAGCLPTKVTLDLAPQPAAIAETRVIADRATGDLSPKVALIDIDGILSHAGGEGLFSSRSNPVDSLVARLEKAERDDNVKAVVLRINSPGGTVAASETMYREIQGFRERTQKPVVVSMAEVAASGGYYISLAADRVLAQQTSVTGSIGVIFQTMNFSKGMAMIGIEGRAVKSAANKDLANPFAPIREEQYAVLQSTVDEFYTQFRDLVAEKRPGAAAKGPVEFDRLTDGRVFTGGQALKAGLVDELGGVREAFNAAKSLAGIQKARLFKYHGRGDRPLSAYSAESPAPTPMMSGDTNVELNLLGGSGADPGIRSQFLYLWNPQTP